MIKIAAIALACGLVIAGVVYGVHLIKEQGATEAINAVEKANNAATAKADQGTADVDECYRTGRTWNRALGVCNNKPAGN